jgi:hypothetical protein
LNHRLSALLLVLFLVLPFASVATHADGTPTTLIFVVNQVNIDYFGGVAISTYVTVVNNGTADTGPLSVNMTYGGVLTPHVANMTSNYNVTNVVTGVDTTSYIFSLDSLTAGNSSQIVLNLQLTGMVQETSPGVKTYNLTSFPFVSISGGLLFNATAFLVLPPGVNVTSDLTAYGYFQSLPGTPTYTLQFTNNTVPQVSFVPVSYVQPEILFSVNNTVSIDNFGWIYTDTAVTVNNTGQAASGILSANLTYFGLYVPYTWSQSSSGTLVSTQATNDTTSYLLSLPSIEAGGSAQLLLHLKTWGMVNEFTDGAYTYNLTNFPIVTIPGGALFNATSLISLPVATTVSSDLTQYGFVQQAPANPTYEQIYTDYSVPIPSVLLVNFTASSADFGLFQINRVQRTVGMAGDGSVLITDTISITNNDTQDLSSINLTLAASGQYTLKEGYVDGGSISLSSGIISLPVPISALSRQNLVIQYELPSSAVKDNSGTLTIDIGSGALRYSNLVQSYSVIFSFPSGTVAQASTPTMFVNQTVMPAVVLTAKVPLGWNLYLATPAIVGLLIAAVFIFFLYRRTDLQPFEEDGISIIQAKAAVITSLLEQYRLRGEGFAPFDDYSAKRKSLEEEKTKVTARLQDYKARSLKDKAQKSFYDKMAVEDARLEQLYREGKASLEECLASRLSQKDFDAKIEKLKLAAMPTDLLRKAEQKQAQPKPAKQQSP